MTLKPYSRDSAYFQSLRDRNMTIAYGDLDTSFNHLLNYLNKDLLPVVDILANKQAVGIEGSEDSFLRNVGNGTTIFDIVRSSDIANYTLTLDRFTKQMANSVIASDNTEKLKAITPTAANQVLTSSNTLVSTWQKLKYSHFENSTIGASKIAIGTLSARHLSPDIIGKPLAAGAIETDYIQNNTIPNAKIAADSFANTKISDALMNTRVTADNLNFKDKCFLDRTVQNNSLDIKNAFFFPSYNNANIFLTNFYKILTPANIQKNSIELGSVNSPSTQIKFNIEKQFDGSIIPTKIKPASLDLPTIRANFNGWVGITTNLKLSKNNLSPEIKAILVNKGGLKP